MGFPDAIGGGAYKAGAAFIGQLRGIVASNLVDKDAKLDLVADYGSDRAVSHHGSWSWLPSSRDAYRTRQIRSEFAKALGDMAGGVNGNGETGSKELNKIIRQLRANTKPLTKREVQQVLDKVDALNGFSKILHGLKENKGTYGSLEKDGAKLSGEIEAFAQKVKDAKVYLTEDDIAKCRQTYQDVQSQKNAFLKCFKDAFPSDENKEITYEQAIEKLRKINDELPEVQSENASELRTFADSLKKYTASDLIKEGTKLLKYDGDVAEYKRIAVKLELKQLLLKTPGIVEKLEKEIPSEALKRLKFDESYKAYASQREMVAQKREEFLKGYKKAFPSEGETITFDEANEDLDSDKEIAKEVAGIRNKLKVWSGSDKELLKAIMKAPLEDGWKERAIICLQKKDLQRIAQETEELKKAIPVEFRTKLSESALKEKTNLDALKKPEQKEDGQPVEGPAGDEAVGAGAFKAREEIQEGILKLQDRIAKLTKELETASADAAKVLDWKSGKSDSEYASECERKFNDQNLDIKQKRAELDGLQKDFKALVEGKYGNTFVAPREFAEVAKKQQEILAAQKNLEQEQKAIDGLRSEIENLKKAERELLGGATEKKTFTYSEALELVSNMKKDLAKKQSDIQALRNKLDKAYDDELANLRNVAKLLEEQIARNEKAIEDEWAKPIREKEDEINKKAAELGDHKKDVDAKKAQAKVDLPRQGKVDKAGETFRISGKWLRCQESGVSTGEINKTICKSIFDQIDGFKDWFAEECRNQVRTLVGCDEGLAKSYFDTVWSKYDLSTVADALRQVLAQQGDDADICMSEDGMKEAVISAMTAKALDAEFGNVGPAETKLKGLTEKKDSVENLALTKLETDFGSWKENALKSVKTVLGEEASKELEDKIKTEYGRLAKAVGEGTLKSLAFGTDEDKTVFNHLCGFLADETTNDKSDLFDVIRKDLDAMVNSYKLDDGNTGKIDSKLQLSSPENDLRIKQDEQQSPNDIVQKLKSQKPKAGLVQKGGNSCWMISVVNGLLASEKGVKILEECFKDSDKCVFKARTKAGKLQTIEVSKDEIDGLMQKKGKVALSQLEVAIWLGVKKMSESKQLFDVKGCNLGAMGEASEAAMLFGLHNAENGEGKSVGDNDSAWVAGANALQKDKLVVLHRRRGDNIQGGHFMTAVGTTFTEGANGAAPEKTFHVRDSLGSNETTTLKSAELNVDASSDELRYNVLTFEFP